MRKFVIVLCTLIIGYSIYALSPSLFPDTSDFPRIPTSPGTVGSILSEIVGGVISDATDGTVRNTNMLSGTSASGYLKNTDCDALGKKWIGVDANGKALCGTSTPILADYGTVSEQGCPANIYHATGTNGTTNTGDTLKSGDILKTGTCGLTIAFADYSILRLDADTTVSLDLLESPTDGRTIASAILSNGSLWGRILTDTGSYSIGTDKIVAGVRGTSVAVVQTGVTITMGAYSGATGKWSMTKVGTPSTPFLAIPHSQSSDNTISGDIGNTTIKIGTSVTGPNMVNFTRNPVETLYQDSPWIRRNTATDLSYMYHVLAFTSPPPPKITTEISISEPTSPTNPEAQNLCENGQTWWTSRYGCQPKTLYALADYTLPVPVGATTPIPSQTTLLYSGSLSLIGLPEMGNNHPPAGINGVEITQTGQYIQYYPDPNFLGSLSGKTITIQLLNNIPSTGTRYYVADLGTEQWFVVNPGSSCNGTVASQTLCRKVGAISTQMGAPGRSITIGMTTTPYQVVIGNTPLGTPAYNFPISTLITRISIQ